MTIMNLLKSYRKLWLVNIMKMMTVSFITIIIVQTIITTELIGINAQGYSNYNPYPSSSMARCSSKLETALQHMFQKSNFRGGNSQTNLAFSSSVPPSSASSSSSSGLPTSQQHQSVFSGKINDNRDRIHEKLDYYYSSPLSKSNNRRSSISDELFDHRDHESIVNDSGERQQPQRTVEVAELRVRLPPQHSRWVRVDKCQFLPTNRTLDTRLIFPDLTISGKVSMRPGTGKQCDMILRLRQAGIEFHTIPIVEERSRAATVRTDSYFSEPGFISVFAHGCEGVVRGGNTGGYRKYRPNSKKNQYFDNGAGGGGGGGDGYDGGTSQYDNDSLDRRHDRYYEPNRRPYDRFYEHEIRQQRDRRFPDRASRRIDEEIEPRNEQYLDFKMSSGINSRDINNSGDDFFFNDDILGKSSFSNLPSTRTDVNNDFMPQPPMSSPPEDRTLSEYFGNSIYQPQPYRYYRPLMVRPAADPAYLPYPRPQPNRPNHEWQSVELANSAEMNDDFSRELEDLFSKGVRQLLTSYMQKALQPAIKETLMESMGYKLSYG